MPDENNIGNIDFIAAFQLRDRLKNQCGLDVCEFKLRELLERYSSSDPIRLNNAICLIENQKYAAGFETLSKVVTTPTSWDPEWKKTFFIYKFISQSYIDAVAAMEDLASTLSTLEKRVRSDLLCGSVLANRISRTDLVRWNEILITNAQYVDFSGDTIKKWFEICSSNNRIYLFDKFKSNLSHEQIITLRSTFSLIDVLYNDLSNAEVERLVRECKWPDLSDIDQYIIALRSLCVSSPVFARNLIKAYIAERPESYLLRRVLGYLYEIEQDFKSARRSYHEASKLELQQMGADARAISNINPSAVRISCITMTYNEAPLVRGFCFSVMPHCDQIVVNDGGSTDETIAEFIRVRNETGFDIVLQNDVQYTNRDRTIDKKNDYRSEGRGGILGFDSSRRRTTSLLAARHDYVLMVDLDERLPAVPNLKNVVAAAYGAEHFAGVKCDIRDSKGYYLVTFDRQGAAPLLFKRHPAHMFGSHTHVNGGDEYLTRADLSLEEFAARHMPLSLSNAFYLWHLKMLLDGRHKDHMDGRAGPIYPTSARFDVPDDLPLGGL